MLNNTLTRNAGYKNAAGKEQQSQAIFEDWANHYGLTLETINGYDNNRLYGDYKLNGKNVEVKSQNIGAYAQNFFELGEITNKQYHAEGWVKLVNLLADYGVDISNEQAYEFFNFGFTPVANGATIFYINRETSLIYVYSAQRILQFIADAVKTKGIQRGRGKANQDTLSTFIPNSKTTFQKINGEWQYTGQPDLQTVLEALGA